MRALSVIVPCLNEAEGIAATLDALSPLRERGVELIVADGGSDDDTVALAGPRADLVVTAPRGRARQMNAGAAHARGEVLFFLHADTHPPRHADALILDGLAASGRDWGRFDVAIAGRNPLLRLVASLMNLRSRWTRVATGDQGVFVRRSLFDSVGGYRDIALMEDVELSERLRRRGAPLCIRQKMTTSGRRWEKHGILRTALLMWRLRLAYRLGADPDKLALRYASHK